MNGVPPKRVVIAGGSGFIGRALAGSLRAQRYEVVILARQPGARQDGVREVGWMPGQIGEWIKHLNGAAALVNLAGRSINCHHTPENLGEILESRVKSINTLAAALEHTPHPPPVWVQAGAVGFYGDTKDRLCDEAAPAGNDALAEICRRWESAFNSAPASSQTRRVLLRMGFVLGRDGGALPVLARLTRWFLGGAVGSGEQFISWIHLEDLCRMFTAVIERDELAGTFNAVGPRAVANRRFMRELRQALRRPWSPPAPVWAVKLGSRLMGTEPSLALAGCRAAPKRFVEAGFKFHFPDLADALEDIFAGRRHEKFQAQT